MLERVWRKGTLLNCCWECKLIQPLWRTVWRFLKKLKIELPYDPAIPHLGIYPEKIIIKKDTRTPMFLATLFTTARTWKQPKCPSTEEWIKKMWYIYTMEYYSAIKREWNSAICRDVDRPRDCHPKGSKSEREKQTLYINAYMWNLEKWYRLTYLQSRNRDTRVENKLMDTKGREGRGGMNWEVGIDTYTLLCI